MSTEDTIQTHHQIVTRSTDPDTGKTYTAKIDAPAAGDVVPVDAPADAIAEVERARSHVVAVVDELKHIAGFEVANTVDEAANRLETAVRLELLSRLVHLATDQINDDWAILYRIPPQGVVESGSGVPPYHETPPAWVFRYRGRRIWQMAAAAFAVGITICAAAPRLAVVAGEVAAGLVR